MNKTALLHETLQPNPIEKLTQLEQAATAFGFAWPDVATILKQITDECAEIQAAIDAQESPERIQEEIGDLLHAAFSLCIFAEFSPEETLEKTTRKFGKRFGALKKIAQSEGYADLQNQSFETLMQLWQQAKNHTQET